MMDSSALYQFFVCQRFCNDFITHELFLVVDDAQDEGAAGAGGHILSVLQVLPRDEEAVPAGARVAVRLRFLIVLEVFDLHLIVEHPSGFPQRSLKRSHLSDRSATWWSGTETTRVAHIAFQTSSWRLSAPACFRCKKQLEGSFPTFTECPKYKNNYIRDIGKTCLSLVPGVTSRYKRRANICPKTSQMSHPTKTCKLSPS